ncbi:MAG: FUSC family protein [Actinomycetales bacterium]|nr:FUSC family protein [Actinomycetales bacterium]
MADSGGPAAERALRRLETAVARRVELRRRGRRVLASLPAIAQIVVAVAAAYSIAHWVLGHEVPVLGVTVTITSLGLTGDARPGRILQSVVGILVGVTVSESLLLLAGRGLPQLLVVILLALVIGRFLHPNPAFAIGSTLPAVIVQLLPAPVAGPYSRTLDAVVGGVVALLVTALIPRAPLTAARRDRRALFGAIDEALGSLVDGLRDGDQAALDLALERLRRTQPALDAWTGSLDTARAVARVSPWLRGRLPELAREAASLTAIELAVRHLRTLTRRAGIIARYRSGDPALAGLVEQLRRAIGLLGQECDDPELAGSARSVLLGVAGRLSPELSLGEEAGDVAPASIVVMLRPLAVDLLVGTGMTFDEARQTLPPV